MDLTRDFVMYVQKNNIEITYSNYEEQIKLFKEKLVSETTEMDMCGYELSLGDWVKVQIGGNGRLSGGWLEGKIIAFYPHIPQVKLESGWCFHPSDEILKHIPAQETITP